MIFIFKKRKPSCPKTNPKILFLKMLVYISILVNISLLNLRVSAGEQALIILEQSSTIISPPPILGVSVFKLEEPTPTSFIELEVPTVDTSFKSFMDYRTITNKSSVQYKLQETAYTDEQGYRRYGNMYMVALGTYYSPIAGLIFEVEFDTGEVISCITGDVKSNADTDASNRYVSYNGNVVEFIVDTNLMDPVSKNTGDMSQSGMAGKIQRISRII